MTVHQASIAEMDLVTILALKLWPEHDYAELAIELNEIASQEDAAFFLAYDGQQTVGFAQCQLRYDYVEGTDSSPVGYLEGIYVEEPFRHCGVARQLLAACEAWARSKGCTEFASDCELDNEASLAFHLNVGFTEANRVICFVKNI